MHAMHTMVKSAAVALGSAALLGALAATAAAQQPAPKAQPGAKAPAAKAAPQRRPPRRPPAKPANDPAITATLGALRSGSFTGVIDPAKNQLCYMLNAPAVHSPTAAHIHKGKPDTAGSPVVTLKAPTDGASGGCQTIPASLAQALESNPHAFYVDVDNATFPHGAVSAQLTGARQLAG